MLAHAGLLALVIGASTLPSRTFIEAHPDSLTQLVFLNIPGPDGGGTGGGDHAPAPPRPAEAPGRDKISVPVSTPQPVPAPTPAPTDEPPAEKPLLAVVPMAAGTTPLAGAIDPSRTGSDSPGPGDGTGAGGLKGSGSGSGDGPGVGEGPYRPGNGITTPRLLNAVKPRYTADAMRARISGSAWVECVVDTQGRVDKCHLTRSLDPNFGLDQEAIRAAQQWTFQPGTKGGEPVPVQVTIELAFSLR